MGSEFEPIVPAYEKIEGGLLGNVRLVWKSFTTSLSLLENARLAFPLLMYFVIKLCIALLYLVSVREPLSSFWAIFLPGTSGEVVSHYPEHLLLMQVILRRLDIFLEIFVHVLFQAVTIALVAAALAGERKTLGSGFRLSASRYPHLIGTVFLSSVSIQVCVLAPDLLLRHLLGPGSGEIATAGAIILGLFAQAFFLYSIPAIIVTRDGLFRAIRKSFSLTGRTLLYTYLLVGIPFILTVPTLLLSFKTRLIAFRLSPEVLIYVLLASELMQLIATYLIVSASTVTYIRRSETEGTE
ncbi:MAG: hypothetical protein JSV33_09505 [bacterium]|nr:MAG: hypothetical protein JSV33_09505 [bacterium]